MPLFCCFFAVLQGDEINVQIVFKQTEGAILNAFLLSTENFQKTLEKSFLSFLSKGSKFASSSFLFISLYIQSTDFEACFPTKPGELINGFQWNY